MGGVWRNDLERGLGGPWRARQREPKGGLGLSPQRGPGAEPLVRGQGAKLAQMKMTDL